LCSIESYEWLFEQSQVVVNRRAMWKNIEKARQLPLMHCCGSFGSREIQMEQREDEAASREAILQRTKTFRPKGFTDERWLAALADAMRLGHGLWTPQEAKVLEGYSRPPPPAI
jgi:hypothetical protein